MDRAIRWRYERDTIVGMVDGAQSASPRSGLVVPVPVDASGRAGPTRGQSRGPYWRTSSPGLFVPSEVAHSTAQRIVEVAAWLPQRAAITGWAALHWQGAHWFPGLASDGETRLPVPVVTLHAMRPPPGTLISQEFMAPWEATVLDGVPITRPVRSAGFEARRARSLGQAVAVLDMTAFSDLTDLAGVREYADRLGPKTGIGQLREAVALGDENAWSPMEVVMRLIWLAARRVRPRCNVPIFDAAGGHIATPDLLDVDAGVAGEYEGALHLAGSRRAKDVHREGILRQHGLEVVTMVSTDRAHPDAFLRRLDDAYQRAESRRTGSRSWTAVPPPWWTSTVTVARRRALSQWQRARYLRYRHAG